VFCRTLRVRIPRGLRGVRMSFTAAEVQPIYERAVALDAGTARFEDASYIGLCNLYLFASYAYYELDDPILGDETFDRLCKYLYNNWDFLAAEGVWHVGLVIIEDNLRAGTCIGVTYPDAVKEIAVAMVARKRADKQTEEYDI
jgi:hypothetical protein